MSITILRLEDILWNNLSYTSVISLKQYISKDTKKVNCKTDFFVNLLHTIPKLRIITVIHNCLVNFY